MHRQGRALLLSCSHFFLLDTVRMLAGLQRAFCNRSKSLVSFETRQAHACDGEEHNTLFSYRACHHLLFCLHLIVLLDLFQLPVNDECHCGGVGARPR